MMNFKDILKKYRTPSKKGFSLVELIVVVAIVSIVSGTSVGSPGPFERKTPSG